MGRGIWRSEHIVYSDAACRQINLAVVIIIVIIIT